MARCASLLYNCPKCERHFRKVERVPICPDCGADLHCTKSAIPGYSFCIWHGGPNPKGNFYGGGIMTTGAGGRFALTRLAAKYNLMKQDGRILSNRKSIEIIRDRITQLLERIDQNQAPDRLANLQKLWLKFREAEGVKDQIEVIRLKAEIDAEFEAAYHDYAAWKQMFEALDLDRKMVESEVKVAKDLQAILTAEDAYELTAKLFASIINAVGQITGVPDNVKSKLLRRVEYEFTRIIGDGQQPADGTDGGPEEEPVGSVREVIDA